MGVCLRGKSGSLAMLAAIRCTSLSVSKKRAVSLESFNSSLTSKWSKSGQLAEQNLGLFQIERVEAFGEPAVLIAAGSSLLLTCNSERKLEVFLSLRPATARRVAFRRQF